MYFNSLAPRGANRYSNITAPRERAFQLTRPAWGEPLHTFLLPTCNAISTHSPRVGRTNFCTLIFSSSFYFNSLAPRGANLLAACPNSKRFYFNSLAPRGANPDFTWVWGYHSTISTHSPRVGRTWMRLSLKKDRLNFNSLAPRGANRSFLNRLATTSSFQLTRPAWGEPGDERAELQSFGDFNSLAPRGANLENFFIFFSKPCISTHSPRVGRTEMFVGLAATSMNFNSLAPRGANPTYAYIRMNYTVFQLTRPAWGEPDAVNAQRELSRISTHSPRVGRTGYRRGRLRGRFGFQLTRPAWGEPTFVPGKPNTRCISTHSPRVGRTQRASHTREQVTDFNSLAPRGANHGSVGNCFCIVAFQLTRPAWGEPNP